MKQHTPTTAFSCFLNQKLTELRDDWQRDQEITVPEAKQQILAAVEKMMLEVIGEGEVHVSHVCPPDSPGCIAFAARGQQRHEQRQRLQTKLYGDKQ